MASQTPPPRRPNILLILVDDMGFADIGATGSEIPTPHLDRLAAGGMVFSQMYNCARCCPTRASLLTGLYPHKAGIGHMVQNRGVPAYQGYLRDDCVTLAEALQPAGYRSMLSGKWHVGGHWPRRPGPAWRFNDPAKPLPTDRGFDRFYGLPGGGSYFNPSPLIDDDRIVPVPEDFYTTDNYTTEAIRFIEDCRRRDQPFFVHLTYNAPHWPLHARAEDIARHRGNYARGWDAIRCERHERMQATGLLGGEWSISRRDPAAPPWDDAPHKDWQDARMATYAAMVDRVDQNIGRLRSSLEAGGQLDDTLILFLSDNGGSAEFLAENGRREGELPFTRDGRPVTIGNVPDLAPGGPETFMSYDLPWANVSCAPFRKFKAWVHEGGISTPLIAHWPARVRQGLTHEPAHVTDLYATCLAAAGAAYPDHRGQTPTQPLDGESFLPLLSGQRWTRSRPICWEHEGNAALRAGRWKIVREHGRDWELYDMLTDRTELTDLAGSNAPRVDEFAGQWSRWADACGVLPWEQVRKLNVVS
jgi:arylsulfatase